MCRSPLPWFRALVLALLVAACARDSTSPPPSGGGNGAVTLTVSAGDGQSAPPGAAVPAPLVVLATNAAGQPAAGVEITFAIDSGGGTITAAQATTSAAGTASPGAWTLGATEGVNVMRASAVGATTIRIRATASVPTVPLLTDVTVPRTGGVVTVALSGNAFDGLTLAIPDTAFAAPAVISIATKNTRVTTLPAGYAQVGPAIVITNSQGIATRPMVLTIPVSVQSADTALAAFFVDSKTGVFELLPVAARTASTLTVFSRHFTSDELMKLSATSRVSPRVSGAASARKTAGFSPAQIIIVSVPAATLNAATTTGFQPGRDDWEFVNRGSILSPGGICAGMSISAMYHFYALRGSGSLNGRYNPIAGGPWRDYTNNPGLRLASLVQEDADYDALSQWFSFVAGYAIVTGVPKPTLYYHSLVMAMQVTRLPQLLAIYGKGFGHAVVAIGSANGAVSFADPNEPGGTRTMTFANGVFAPFPFASRGGGPSETVDEVQTIGASALIDATALASLWTQVGDASIGRARFPATVNRQYDEFTERYVDVDTSKAIVFRSIGDYALRTVCTACTTYYFLDETKLINTKIIDEAGTLLNDGGSDYALVSLRPGVQRFGVIESMPLNQSEKTWARFRWVTVNYQPVSILPKRPNIKPDSTLNFSVTTGDLAPRIVKYTWKFNDNQPDESTTAATVSHRFANIGSYNVVVSMSDAANTVIAKDSTTVTVGLADLSYSVWVMSNYVAVTTGTVGTPGQGNEAGLRARRAYDAALAYWQRPPSGILNPTLWYVTSATGAPAGVVEPGLYFTDSLPASGAAGRDPALSKFFSPTDSLTRKVADDPLFNPRWQVTGAPPTNGSLTAIGPIPPNYQCGFDFFSAWTSTSVNFSMNATQGSGVITYTYRDLTPSCTRPNVDAARWRLTVTFDARRVR